MKNGVVILNYNSHDLTVALAKHIAEFENVHKICVVDNNSLDNFDNDFDFSEKIHYIKNPVNKGYSAGNNVGLRYLIREENCDIAFVANPDVVFEADAINEIVKQMELNPRLVIASLKRFGYRGDANIHQYFDFPSYSKSVAECFFLLRYNVENNIITNQLERVEQAKNILFVDAVPGAFVAFRGTFLEKNNYMYEGIFLYGEEIIIGKQAELMGYQSGIINTATYIHNHKRMPFSNKKMFWYGRKSLIKYFRMFDLIGRVKAGILWLAASLGTAEYYCLYFIYSLFQKIRRK